MTERKKSFSGIPQVDVERKRLAGAEQQTLALSSSCIVLFHAGELQHRDDGAVIPNSLRCCYARERRERERKFNVCVIELMKRLFRYATRRERE